MIKRLASIAFLLSVVSPSAFADCHIANLRSTDGTDISVHYSSNSSDGDTAWINPTLHVLLPSNECVQNANVEVTLVEVQQAECGGGATSQTVTLARDPQNACHFLSAAPSTVVFLANHCGPAQQQLAVRVSVGNTFEWLTDPMNGQHNFNYQYQTNYSSSPEVCQ